MITIDNNVGRLVEIRQTGKVTVAEIQASFGRFQKVMATIDGPVVFATDWRGMRLLDRETADLLMEIMKNDEGVEAQVVLTDKSALMGLQIRRLFQSGGGKRRAVYDDAHHAELFLKPHLSAAELEAFRKFVASHEPKA